MTLPPESSYPEKSSDDWSLVRFAFEGDSRSVDEDMGEEVDDIEPQKTLRQLLEENDLELRNKVCSRCKQSLSLNKFNRDAHTKSGWRSRCKKCVAETSDKAAARKRTRKSRENNPDHYNELNRKWSKTFRTKHPERIVDSKKKWRERNPYEKRKAKDKLSIEDIWLKDAIVRCKARAHQKSLPFGMTADDLLEKNTKTIPTFCPIFPHIRLDYAAGPDRRLWASIDKIVPALGYVSGNVWIVSMAANLWKNNGSNPAERERIVAIMHGHKKQRESDPQQPSLFESVDGAVL